MLSSLLLLRNSSRPRVVGGLATMRSTTACFFSSNSNNNNRKSHNPSFRPRRRPGGSFRGGGGPIVVKSTDKKQKQKGMGNVYSPVNTRSRPVIDLTCTTAQKITNAPDEALSWEDVSDLGPLAQAALEKARHAHADEEDMERLLKFMDFYTSAPGSTEDLLGQRHALRLEGQGDDDDDMQVLQQHIETLVERERQAYNMDMHLPLTEPISLQELQQEEVGGGGNENKIPHNQLAHGDWGEMLIRTDRVCKMWRGGRIESYRALVVGGNLRGCGGFGIGKAFEPEDAVQLACRMARRNIFFVDRYQQRTICRDLVGRQNSCKVYLRSTNNGLRGNPVAVEILKFMGITNVVAKAHGARSHANVVRATFKALQTHESLEEMAMKRGVRLVNLQKAKRLQI